MRKREHFVTGEAHEVGAALQQAHMPVGGVQLVPAHREPRSTAQHSPSNVLAALRALNGCALAGPGLRAGPAALSGRS